MKRIRLYNIGDKVLCGLSSMKMIVVAAAEDSNQWRYELAFQNKNGTQNKKKNHRFFYQDMMRHQFEPLKIK